MNTKQEIMVYRKHHVTTILLDLFFFFFHVIWKDNWLDL